MTHTLKKFATWMDGLKKNQQALVFLIGLDLLMAIASNIVDWPWMMSVEWYLRPFAPICSLFPGALAVWFTIYLIRKKVPAWFTTFIFIGIISYGIMAYVYYPLFIHYIEFTWRLPGNMLWVTIYALQSLIIASELKPTRLYQFALIIAYYLFKDYSDRYLGSFIDGLRPDFPGFLKDFLFVTMLLVHMTLFTLVGWNMRKKRLPQKVMAKVQTQKV